ncbi:hypothetical protein ACJJH9_00005 (plasmid) [Microbulbifer sp. DLAB2-AF]|uniref:hypothetical protein n=1 Tax=Microbulbifer sp. DLAB2-AF TaxID=3243395 RepID=UPI00403902B0
MALQLIKGIAPYWYTPKSFEKEEIKPEIQLNPLTQQQLACVLNDSTNGPNGIVPSPQARQYLLNTGVKDWRNVLDADGKEIQFSAALLPMLPWNVQIDIATQLIYDAMLGEEQSKNSPSQSMSAATPSDLIATTANGEDTATTQTQPQ